MFAGQCANAYSNTDRDAHADVDSMRWEMFTNTTPAFDPRTETIGIRLPLLEIAPVLARVDHIASVIVNADCSIV